MDIKLIKELAEKTGLAPLYDRPRLTDMGDGTIRLVSSGQLTYYGQNVVKFANEIERQIRIENTDKDKIRLDWVSTKDALPTPYDDVLMCVDFGENDKSGTLTLFYGCYKEDKWFGIMPWDEPDSLLEEISGEIVSWASLPTDIIKD